LLIWKRRFAEAGAAIGFVIVFNAAAPALIWGPDTAWNMLAGHVHLLLRVVTLADPSENGIQIPTHRSQGLTFAVSRYLQTYPPGHPLFIDRDYDDNSCTERASARSDPNYCRRHPLFVQFMDLPGPTAGWIVTAVLLLIAVAMAWRMRREWLLAQTQRGSQAYSSLAPEWAVATAFAALLSPLAWHQHLILVLPCGYLVLRDALTRVNRSRLREVALGIIFICVWVLQRDNETLANAMSYHLDVLAVLIMIVLT
jgi:hypothetical protein